MRLPSYEPVGLRLRNIGTINNPKIQVDIFLYRELEEREERMLLDDIIRCAELKTDINDFYNRAEHDLVLKHIITNLYGMRCGQQQKLFHNIVRALTMQWASLERTKQMLKLLFQKYSQKILFNRHVVSVWFTPKQIIQADLQELKECKLGFRARYIKAIANSVLNEPFLSFDELIKLPFEKAKKELIKLDGIGEYSAEIALPHKQRFPIDTWSVKIFWKLLFPERDIKSVQTAMKEVKEEAEKRWNPWQSYAFIYIINGLKASNHYS